VRGGHGTLRRRRALHRTHWIRTHTRAYGRALGRLASRARRAERRAEP
jgi:Ser/Thr protein kinase RdoA (MazF antagonist)